MGRGENAPQDGEYQKYGSHFLFLLAVVVCIAPLACKVSQLRVYMRGYGHKNMLCLPWGMMAAFGKPGRHPNEADPVLRHLLKKMAGEIT